MKKKWGKDQMSKQIRSEYETRKIFSSFNLWNSDVKWTQNWKKKFFKKYVSFYFVC